MGKLVKNGVVYGVDDSQIKTSLSDCENGKSNDIIGSKVLKDFKTTHEATISSEINSICDAFKAQGATIPTDKNFTDISKSVDTISTNKYNAGVSATKKGTAAAAQVRSGYTFTNSSSVNISGTMANYTGANVRKTFTPGTSSGSYTIPSGYHDGQGTVTCTAVSATATLGATNGTKVDMSGAYRYVNTQAVYNAGYNAGYAAKKTVSSCFYGVYVQSYCRKTNQAWKENKIWINVNNTWKVQAASLDRSYDSGNIGF